MSLKEYCKFNAKSAVNSTYYVCRRCNLVFGHAVNYCPTCPGRMEQVKFSTYGQIMQEIPDGEWGEDKAWRDENRSVQLHSDKERSEKCEIPVRVIFWIHRLNANNFTKSVRACGFEDKQAVWGAETFEPDTLEYAFVFKSYREARDFIYKHKTISEKQYMRNMYMYGYFPRMIWRPEYADLPTS